MGKTRNGDTTKDIAWRVFLEPLNQVTTFEKINPKEFKKRKKIFDRNKKPKVSLNNNTINDCFSTWKLAEFLTPIVEYKERVGNYKVITIQKEYGKIKKSKVKSKYYYPYKLEQFNLLPVFHYLETKNEQLTDSEIFVLSFLFDSKPIREKLYLEYKDRDFITAILDFYVKYYCIPYLKNPKIKTEYKFDKDTIKNIIEKGKKPTSEKDSEKINLFDGGNVWFDKKGIVSFNHEFYLGHYASFHKYYKDIIERLDNKILRSLGLA